MSLKNIVASVIVFACVSLAAVAAAAQDTSPGFAFTMEQGVATVVKGGVGAGVRVPVEASVVKGAPFSADIVTESIQTLSDGNRIVQRSSTRVYRDSEGRVRREEDRGPESPAITISDPVRGQSYSLDPDNRVAWQTPNMAGFRITEAFKKASAESATRGQHEISVTTEKLQLMLPAAQERVQLLIEQDKIGRGRIDAKLAEQVKLERLPARDVQGVRAEGTRRTTTIAAGTIGNELPIEIVSEEWTSPDLKILVTTEYKDPRLGTSTYRLTNIVRAEPDRYLFEVPSDYTLKESGMFRWTTASPKK